jgi:hypothetical protein
MIFGASALTRYLAGSRSAIAGIFPTSFVVLFVVQHRQHRNCSHLVAYVGYQSISDPETVATILLSRSYRLQGKSKMLWARLLAHVTGTVNQELLLRNEYLAAENRILLH